MKRTWLTVFTMALLVSGLATSAAQPGSPADPVERTIGHLEKARAALTEDQIRSNPQVQLAYDELTKALEAARETRTMVPAPPPPSPVDPLGLSNPFGPGVHFGPPPGHMGGLFEDMRRMRQEMDDMMHRSFSDFATPGALGPPGFADPRMGMNGLAADLDIKEEDDHYVVTIDLPGVGKDDIKIEARESHLQISGTREEALEETNERNGFIRRERRVGSFSRTVPLPGPINPGAMEAAHENGVLKITAQKKQAEEEKSRIVIVK